MTEQLVLDLVDTLAGGRLVGAVVDVYRRVQLTCGCTRVEATRPGGGIVHTLEGAHCDPAAPMRRRARLRLLALGGRASDLRYRDVVAYWDARTSANDARAALSIAAGADPNGVHPALGTWSGP